MGAKDTTGLPKARCLRQPARRTFYHQSFAFRGVFEVSSVENKVHAKEPACSAYTKIFWTGDDNTETAHHIVLPQLKGDFSESEFEEDRRQLD
ncbi:hypothetical protein K7H22_01440 [Seohaeicola saemankumensis]|nr:hypothetical protein [Seohaeicola saemankumensis]